MKKIVMASVVSVLSLVLAAPLLADEPATQTNSFGMKFVRVPPGTFTMGSEEPKCPDDDPKTPVNERDDCRSKTLRANETPAHRVVISKGFWIGQFEVTQAQWEAVMSTNPSRFKSDKQEEREKLPVENVLWEDVQEFIRQLNEKEGKQYRLPTEAEWEYVCRGGKNETFCGGNDPKPLAWFVDNSGMRPQYIGTKQANGFKVHDMSGNVWEWVNDWYGRDYYLQSSEADPQGPAEGEQHTIRGGSWGYDMIFARAANRGGNIAVRRCGCVGFRLVDPE